MQADHKGSVSFSLDCLGKDLAYAGGRARGGSRREK